MISTFPVGSMIVKEIFGHSVLCFTFAWFPHKLQGYQAHVCVHAFQVVKIWFGLHIVVTIASIDLSQEIFAIDILTALKSSLKHLRKHVQGWLRLFRD